MPSYTVIETEFTSTWTTTKSDGSIVTGSGIVSQSGTSLTTLTTFAPSSSSSSEITPEFTSTWEISSSNESNVVESSIVNQSNESLTNSVSSYEPATESAIVSPSDQVLTSSATSFVSASEFSAVTTTTVDSASASSSTDINNDVTVLVSHRNLKSILVAQFGIMKTMSLVPFQLQNQHLLLIIMMVHYP